MLFCRKTGILCCVRRDKMTMLPKYFVLVLSEMGNLCAILPIRVKTTKNRKRNKKAVTRNDRVLAAQRRAPAFDFRSARKP